MSRIFINYRRQDTEGYVGRLYDHLTQHFQPDDIFMDVQSIEPGADFVQTLDDAVAECDVFIAMIGPQWLNIEDASGERRLDLWNDFVRIEIASALKQEKVVIPVLVGQAKMPNPNALPDDLKTLARRNAIELSHQRFRYDVDKLIATIKQTVTANTSFKQASDPDVLSEKEQALRALRDQLVNASDSPLYDFRVETHSFPVLGEGNADANLLFIGEAPGKYEAEQGIPFCGPSGDVLDEMLASIQLKREDVFLTNILHDRPTAKRQPTKEEMAYYEPYVDQIIDIIRPAVIISLGRFAMQYVLKKLDLPEKRQKISQLHGKLIKTQMAYGKIHVVPLYHPAVVLYSASQRETLQKDFEKLKLFV